MLLIVAPNERKVRIEVGYGLEGTLTDAVTKLIIENAILPRFRAGDIPGGISRGVEDVVALMTGNASQSQQPAISRPPGSRVNFDGWFFLVSLALGVAVIVIVLVQAGRGGGRRAGTHAGYVAGPWVSQPSSGTSSWSSSGSGSSSDSGFSAGGGSFGGGGSSGDW